MTLSTGPFAIVVEDDPIIMMGTTSILEDAGFRVHESFNADEAVILLTEHWESTVLLFSDVDMPGAMNGFALARYVTEHWPSIDIAIASGHMLPERGDMPEKATFITKAFSQQIIINYLKRVLANKRAGAFEESCLTRMLQYGRLHLW
jgi:DNA-binding NtrC family response regulator